ncbi:uncharacterized protein DEA37_0011913 [Paragonimus westermani]|uniref:Integrase zinc-binding domain-containing protein n=1 Tax=Paragonimus westermani TaxID=34504 RepID=A0A5J4NR19_9TREM|nr:uncharacterized protein DEA37_0011913 [Paragonimus westermani]
MESRMEEYQQSVSEMKFRLKFFTEHTALALPAGKENCVPDLLSRTQHLDEVHKDVTAVNSIELEGDPGKLQAAQRMDTAIRVVIDPLLSREQPPEDNGNPELKVNRMHWPDLQLDSAGILIRQLRDGINVSVIPAELRAANVRECNQPAHTGCHRTYEVLKQRAYWPGRKNDVDNHVRACQQCQLVKSNNHPSQYPTQPIPSYTRMVHQSMFLGVLSMHHPTLPRDPRTLMRTPRDCPEKYIGSGVYVHFGLEKASLRHFSLPGNDDYISTQLQLHIDRVSPFNASKTQF